MLRVPHDTAGHRRQQDRCLVGQTLDDYTNCCASGEVWTVVPNSAAHRDIHLLLTFNSKVKGRCVRHGYPPLGLRASDRLESKPNMADVMRLERLIELLVIVLFWRSPEHRVVHRRQPLVSFEIGTSIDEFRVEVLHTLQLDIFQDLILRALLAVFWTVTFSTQGAKRSQ